jgi:hypothetical protein
MNERTKQLVEQAGLTIEEGKGWVFMLDKDFFDRFSALVRQDEREQLRSRTPHEQQLMDGQSSLLKGRTE